MDVGCDHTFAALSFLVFYFVPLIELYSIQSSGMNENILSGIVVCDESIAFGFVEKFNCTSHCKKININNEIRSYRFFKKFNNQKTGIN